jgi:hypothetical protein
MTIRTWKKFDSIEYFANIEIPDDWDTLEDFVQWYVDARMPLMVPWNAEVIHSDDASAVCVFRKGMYQVEFYLEFPQMQILEHSHPDMEVIIMQLGGGSLAPKQENGTSMKWGITDTKLMPGEVHGGISDAVVGDGFVTLAFQKWYKPEEMTSAAIQWKGKLHGPIQADLIRSHNENALIVPGYADISANKEF